METTDVTIRILRDIQGTLGGLRDDMSSLRVEHGERFDRVEDRLSSVETRLSSVETRLSSVEDGIHALHTNAVHTNTTLGIVAERLKFFERASTAASEGRLRLDERVDRLDARVDRIEVRLDERDES
ncbi:hypothetical protein [Paraliomyxa miuraensis]|uniref:hypothetical protein n=1 Tax=Paraliomyxa miuraensis TaxID=376150 RepID=UPI00224D7D40|nr:hypothetical protein [Paraliomyxa miuraensis]MCX4247532.1 hypothetical protein [Paraliomyxa miuraensis]